MRVCVLVRAFVGMAGHDFMAACARARVRTWVCVFVLVLIRVRMNRHMHMRAHACTHECRYMCTQVFDNPQS